MFTWKTRHNKQNCNMWHDGDDDAFKYESFIGKTLILNCRRRRSFSVAIQPSTSHHLACACVLAKACLCQCILHRWVFGIAPISVTGCNWANYCQGHYKSHKIPVVPHRLFHVLRARDLLIREVTLRNTTEGRGVLLGVIWLLKSVQDWLLSKMEVIYKA